MSMTYQLWFTQLSIKKLQVWVFKHKHRYNHKHYPARWIESTSNEIYEQEINISEQPIIDFSTRKRKWGTFWIEGPALLVEMPPSFSLATVSSPVAIARSQQRPLNFLHVNEFWESSVLGPAKTAKTHQGDSAEELKRQRDIWTSGSWEREEWRRRGQLIVSDSWSSLKAQAKQMPKRICVSFNSKGPTDFATGDGKDGSAASATEYKSLKGF